MARGRNVHLSRRGNMAIIYSIIYGVGHFKEDGSSISAKIMCAPADGEAPANRRRLASSLSEISAHSSIFKYCMYLHQHMHPHRRHWPALGQRQLVVHSCGMSVGDLGIIGGRGAALRLVARAYARKLCARPLSLRGRAPLRNEAGISTAATAINGGGLSPGNQSLGVACRLALVVRCRAYGICGS